MKQVTLLEKYFYLLANAHSEYECIEDWVLDKTNADEVKEYNKDLVSREMSSMHLIDFILENAAQIKEDLKVS
jgi:hypothetical protein